jgi:hypothetical protein
MKYSPEIAKEVSARSSRDRIARGVVLNAGIAAIALRHLVPVWIMALLCLASLGMWLFFEANSYVFELRAEEAIIRENERAGAIKPADTALPATAGAASSEQTAGQSHAARG